MDSDSQRPSSQRQTRGKATRGSRWKGFELAFIENRLAVQVRFQEVDLMKIAWHGHYLSWFEEGRNALGRPLGIAYEDIFAAELLAPIVHVDVDYLAPATFPQTLTVISRLHRDPGARLLFSFEIWGPGTADSGAKEPNVGPTKLATGRSVQVFTDSGGALVLTPPPIWQRLLRDASIWSDSAATDPSPGR